jgi:thymidine phosphorylase
MDTWRAMIAAQGGDLSVALPAPAETHTVVADRGGVLVEQLALPFGVAAWRLGAGRARAQDPVVHAAGIDLHVKPGDAVVAGQPLFTLNTNDPARFERAVEALEGAYRIGDAGEPVVTGGPLIAGRVAD